jgi:hypothetical protein
MSTSIPVIFFFVFFAVFAIIVVSILATIIKGIGRWTANSAQPVQQDAAEVVAKRTEVSGGQNSTSTHYYATFELPGGLRKELGLAGAVYGQLAEGDRGQLTHQGTRFLGFVRQPRSACVPPPIAPPAPPSGQRVCTYCGSVLPPEAVKCASCGWAWRPTTPTPGAT